MRRTSVQKSANQATTKFQTAEAPEEQRANRSSASSCWCSNAIVFRFRIETKRTKQKVHSKPFLTEIHMDKAIHEVEMYCRKKSFLKQPNLCFFSFFFVHCHSLLLLSVGLCERVAPRITSFSATQVRVETVSNLREFGLTERYTNIVTATAAVQLTHFACRKKKRARKERREGTRNRDVRKKWETRTKL